MKNLKAGSQKKKSLKDKRVLVNAGPTYENIDPVRFIGNYSTGRMGIEIADAAASRGAIVTLVLGPTALRPVSGNIRIINVVTAAEMAEQCTAIFREADIAILAAAVADFRPAEPGDKKIKRGSEDLTIRLLPTTDIAATLGKVKKKNQFLAGFALETDNEIKNASGKLARKNLDMIVLNSLADSGAGFGYDTNLVTIIDKSNNIDKFELKSKAEVAEDILDKIESLINKGQ